MQCICVRSRLVFLCVCVFWGVFCCCFCLFFPPITTLDIIYAGVVLSSRLIQCGEDWTHIHSHYFFYLFFFTIYCFYSPTLSHMASPSGPTSASQGLLSIWQKGWRKAFEHPINCHAGCSVMPTTFIPSATWHITSVPAHHAAICRSKLKHCSAINSIDHLHSGRAHFHNVSFIIWGRN